MKSLISVVLLCLGFSGALLASELMPKTSETGVSYYVGGVGVDQREAINQSFGNYSLRVEVAEKGGAYTADVRLCVYDAQDSKLLDVVMHGPIALVNLPDGQYRLEAFYGAESQTRKVSVKGGKQTKTTFLW